MSEQPAANPSPEEPKKARAKDPKRWGRRLRWTVIVLLSLLVVFRIGLDFLVPWVINRVALGYGFRAEYERMDLSLLGGDVGLWHFQLFPKDGGESLARSGYMRCNIDPLQLLRGRLMIFRLEAEDMDVVVERKADGTVPLLKRFASAPVAPPVPVPPTPGSPNTAVDLTSPLRIEAFRLTNVHAHIRDSAVTPEVDSDLELNVLLTDVDSMQRPTHLTADISAAPILDLMHIEATGTARGQTVDATMSIQVRGLHPRPAGGYLQALGLAPGANYIAMRASAELHTKPAAVRVGAVMGNLTLNDLSVIADGVEAAAVNRVSVDVEAMDTTTAILGTVSIDGVRCQAQRTAAGVLEMAGVALSGSAPKRETPPPPRTPMAPIHWGIEDISLTNLTATLHDLGVQPATDLVFQVSKATAGGIFPDQSVGAVTVDASCSAPGIARSIKLSGAVTPFGGVGGAKLKLEIAGIRPDALAPYLEAAGLESTFKDGTFSCAVQLEQNLKAGGLDARLSDAVLRDGNDLLTIKSAQITGASYDPVVPRLSVDSIEIHGPALNGERDESGAFEFLGLRTIKAVATSAIPAAPASTGPSAVAALPAVRIGRFLWTDIAPRFEDKDVTPPTVAAFSDAGVEITGLDYDPTAVKAAPAGRLHAWLRWPGMIDQLEAFGRIDPSGPAMRVVVSGSGITSEGIDKYFADSPIEPTVRDGSVSFQASVGVAKEGGLNVAMEDFSYAEAGKELIGADSVEIEAFQPGASRVGTVTIDSPRLSAIRHADGSVDFAGIRIKPPPPPVEQGKFAQLTSAEPQATTMVAPRKRLTLKGAAGEVVVHGGSLRWEDDVVAPVAKAQVTLDADLRNLAMDQEAGISLKLTEERALGEMTIEGTMVPSFSKPSMKLAIAAQGMRGGALGGYLPAGVGIGLKDGRFSTGVDAAADLDVGSGHFTVSNLDYEDGENGPPILKLDQFKVVADRIDAAGKEIALDEIRLDGLEGTATFNADGTVGALGLTIGGAAPAAIERIITVTAPSTRTASDVRAVSVKNLTTLVGKKYPLVTLHALDLNVRRFTVINASQPAAKPLVIADARLSNVTPIQLLGDDPASGPPVNLELKGALQPVAGSVAINLSVTPFADQPVAVVNVSVQGIRGAGLTDLEPALADRVDGSNLTDGRFKLRMDVGLKLPRTDPLKIDLSKGFGLDATIKGMQFTDGGKGAVLAGVGEITADGVRVLPGNGGVDVKDVEINQITFNGYRDAAGIHALGMLVKLPGSGPATTAPTDGPGSPVSVAAQTRPSSPIHVEQLLVSGLDFNFEDRTFKPSVVVPLNQLDLEVHDLSNMMQYETRPCRFALLVNAAKVGEKPELFSQLQASGQVALYPKMDGWIKSSISGLDLTQLRGPAATKGVTLAGGTFDGELDIYPNGINPRLSVTDLSLAEPPNGPIQTHYKLNVPLNIAIGLVEAPDKSIAMDQWIPMQEGQISPDGIRNAVDGAIGQVIFTAIASAPVKAVELFLPPGGANPKDYQPITIPFAVGDTSLGAADLVRLKALVKRLKEDHTLVITLRNDLGTADVAMAALLANPSPADCMNLAYRLHAEKTSLLQQRNEAAAQAQAQLASGFGSDASSALDRVREIDQELAATEDALDRVYDLMRPGASRQASRRTRAASLEIGQDRLDAINAAILAAALPATPATLAELQTRIKAPHASYNAAKGVTNGSVTITLGYKKQQ